MKQGIISSLGMAVLVSSSLVKPALAALTTTDTFGSGVNVFTMDFVTIGNPGNVNDTHGAGYGGVVNTFRLNTYEVSVDMVSKANAAGSLSITYDARPANKPATSVSWNEAARFVNWLNVSSGSVPAYKFSSQPGDGGYNANDNIVLWSSGDTGYNAANPFRNSNAKYFLPSENEWYKAAYYSGTGSTYYDYPTGSNTAPTAVVSGTDAGTAVYGISGPADINRAGGLSFYGTMGQGGNAWEWTETEFDGINDSSVSVRLLRGGSWPGSVSYQASSSRILDARPWLEGSDMGFRVASVPIPSSGVDFRVTSVSVMSGGSQVQLTWTSEPSATYTIESSLDLAALSWTEVATGILSQGGSTTRTFDITPGPRRFFRVVKQP